MTACKTLHIVNAFHAQSGGIGTFYRALLQAANRLQRPMRLVAPGEKEEVQAVGSHGLIYYVPAGRALAFDRRYRLLLPHQYLLPQGRIAAILRAEQPDIVEISDKYTLPYLGGQLRLSLMRGVKRPTIVATSHERLDDSIRAFLTAGRLGSWFARLCMRRLYFPLFDAHIANSLYTAEELVPASFGHRIPRSLNVLPMGVDLEAFQPAAATPQAREELCQRIQAPASAALLLYAGRVSPEKNVMVLADMLGRLSTQRDCRLLVAGEGPLLDDLQRSAAQRAPGRFIRLGHVRDRQQLASLYANCDAFLHPNPREPFGIGPLEAMAAGCSVVVPQAGGVLSYANQQNAWLAEPTGAGFAAAVERLLASPQEAAHKKQVARQTAEAHAWPRVADRFFNLYDELHAARLRLNP